jgi:hypothetical protein
MSGVGKWSLGIGSGLLAAAVLCSLAGLVPVSVIAGILGLVTLGVAAYDALYEWLGRAQLRRRGARAARDRGTPQDR